MKTSRMIDKYKIFAHEYQKQVNKTNIYQYAVGKMDTNQTTKSSKFYERRTEISPPQLHAAPREPKHLRHCDLPSSVQPQNLPKTSNDLTKPYRRNLLSPANTETRRNGKEVGLVERLGLVPINHVENKGRKGQIFAFKKRVLPLGLEQEQEDIKQLQILRGKKDRNFFWAQ
jgi:hypothetical protein